MMMPSIFGENLFDDWMDFPFEKDFFGGKNPLYGKNAKNMMKTDEITAQLKDGYMTISASKGLDKDEKDKKAVEQQKYISIEG